MAGNAVIGALRVVLGADTASLEDGLKSAQGKLTNFGDKAGAGIANVGASLAKFGAVAGVAVAGAAAGIAAAVVKVSENIGEIGRAAQKAGVSVDEFQVLASLAKKSGVGLDELSGSLARLSKNMSLVASGKDSGGAADAFAALGISVKDTSGKLKSADDIIAEVAGKFENFSDGANKTALAIAIFGKSGADLVPLLNKGKNAIADMAEENERLGISLDQKTVVAAEKFNDAMRKLGKIQDGIVQKLTVGILPTLEQVSAALVKASKDSDLMANLSEGLSLVFKKTAEIGLVLVTVIGRIGAEFKALSDAGKLLSSGEFSKAWETLTAATAETDKVLAALKGRLAGLWDQPTQDVSIYGQTLEIVGRQLGLLDRIQIDATKDFSIFGQTLDIVGDQLRLIGQIKVEAPNPNGFEDLRKKVLELSLQTRVLNGDFNGLAPGFVEAAHGLKLFGMNAEENRTTVAQLSPALLQLNAAQLAFKGAQITQENLAPWVAYEQQLGRINQLYAAGVINVDIYTRAVQKAADTAGISWNMIGANIASTFGALSQLTATFAKENKAMGIASKAFGIAQAVINTQIAITKALATLPPPASYVAVGLAIAQGAASIAAISAQSFAKGGSFTVPGGVSMTDNKLMPMALASGERVTVEPAGTAGARGGNRSMAPIEINMGGRARYGRDEVRDLLGAINDALGDGARLRLKAA